MKWLTLVLSAIILIGCGKGDNNTNYPKSPKRYVTVDVLNIREGPGTNFRIIGTRKALEYFVLLEEKNKWSKICIPGHLEEGWVWSDYLANTRDNAIYIRNEIKSRELQKSISLKQKQAEILSWSWEYEELGGCCFLNWRAEVRNNCNTAKGIQLKITFYDSNDVVLAFHERGISSNIPPHGTDTIGGGKNYSCNKPVPKNASIRVARVIDPI